jgi:murein DD-endopeptidase MepM/ murein hydrolase activator NlpD
MNRAAIWLAAALLPLPALAANPATETEHIVGEGETLNGIANRAGVSSKALAEANGLKAPFALRIGQMLKIPRLAPAAAKTPTRAPASTRPPARAGTAAPQSETVHVVAEGETLMGIANRAKVPRVLIAEANGLTPPYMVKAGQKLLIPRTRRYTVKPGDTGFAIAYKHAVPWSQIAVANGLSVNAAVTPGKELLIPTVLDPAKSAPAPSAQVAKTAATSAAAASAVASAAVAAATAPAGKPAPRFAWPLEGTVRRGWKSNLSADRHDGLDIVAPRGTAVRAAAAGTVLFAGLESEQFGNLVVVDHGDGWNTAYGFLSRITVKQGAKVAAGERVGLVGDTGRARGNELHFEVRQDGAPVDPAAELPPAQ